MNELTAIRCNAHFALLVASGLLASCASVGPGQMVSTHVAYNEAVQLTVTREVLVNVVRGRYSDPMSFLIVEAINASFSVNVAASAGIGGIGGGLWSAATEMLVTVFPKLQSRSQVVSERGPLRSDSGDR